VRLILLFVCLTIPSLSLAEDPEAAARAVMDEFLSAFNARDEVRWAETLHFPHVRIASNGLSVEASKQAFVANTDLEQFAIVNDWDFSAWDSIELVQAGSDKVHFKVVFSRFNPQGERYVTFNSLYILQKIDGKWAIRARSSFAP
jgi:hypothetical protein